LLRKERAESNEKDLLLFFEAAFCYGASLFTEEVMEPLTTRVRVVFIQFPILSDEGINSSGFGNWLHRIYLAGKAPSQKYESNIQSDIHIRLLVILQVLYY
jgi:hypothetical protein